MMLQAAIRHVFSLMDCDQNWQAGQLLVCCPPATVNVVRHITASHRLNLAAHSSCVKALLSEPQAPSELADDTIACPPDDVTCRMARLPQGLYLSRWPCYRRVWIWRCYYRNV